MELPPRYPSSQNHVCKLLKSLYGLKQTSRQQFAKPAQELHNQDYVQSSNDYLLFVKKKDLKMTFIFVYVDDIILIGNDHQEALKIKHHLYIVLSIKDLGKFNYFQAQKSAIQKMVWSFIKISFLLLLESGFKGSYFIAYSPQVIGLYS